MRVEKDEWLSSVLGISSWKALDVAAGMSCTHIKAALVQQADRTAAFFSAKIPTRDVVAVKNATEAGFSVVDVNVTFDWMRAADDGCEASTDRSMNIETAGSGDTAAIEQIAAHCFTFSRFHLDPIIGPDRANDVKFQWARNACRGRAAAVYVARRHSDVTGFLAVLENKSGPGTDAVIDLVGVDSRFQGQGVGRALSRMFIDRWRDHADRLRVGTQISNIPAMRLYESLGFRVTETAYVLHAHVENGALAT